MAGNGTGDRSGWTNVLDQIALSLKEAVSQADAREATVPLAELCTVSLPDLDPWDARLKELANFLERVENNSKRAQAELEASEHLLREWADRTGALRRRLTELTEYEGSLLHRLDEDSGKERIVDGDRQTAMGGDIGETESPDRDQFIGHEMEDGSAAA